MFESALAEGESGQVLGEALYLGREYVAAVAHHERAYVAYRRERQSMAAGRAAERLDRVARAQRGPYLRAVTALARGRVGVAGGRGDARGLLHQALAGFAQAQLPMELARTRLELARALAEEVPEVAVAEARAALVAFERLQAASQPTRPGRCCGRSASPAGPAPAALAR